MENPIFRQAGEVTFAETDASGWMHFPHVFKYVETAEHAFLSSAGILVFRRDKGGWPRVKVTCDYHRPLLAGDRFEVLLDITRVGTRSVTWAFEIIKDTGEMAASGSITNVRVDHQGKSQPISAEERSALETRSV